MEEPEADTPEEGNEQRTSVEFDLRDTRLAQIGKNVNRIRRAHFKTEKAMAGEQTLLAVNEVQDYYSAVRELVFEIAPYLDNKDDSEDLRQELEDLKPEIDTEGSGSRGELEDIDHQNILRSVKNLKEDLEKLDQKVNRKRIQVGLDIPKKTRMDPSQGGITE